MGYGTTENVNPGDHTTEEEAETRLLAGLIHYENAVERLVKIPLTQYEFDALVSLTYNIGPTNFSRSTLLKCVNRNEKKLAAKHFLDWNKVRKNGHLVASQGLANRRRTEAKLFSVGAPQYFQSDNGSTAQ